MEDLPKIKTFYAADCSTWLAQATCEDVCTGPQRPSLTLPEPSGATNTGNPYSLCLYTVDKK